MRIVFLGSPAFALPSLEARLASGHEVVAVVSQPDRPAGRGHRPTPPPAKLLAQARGIAVIQAENVSEPGRVEQLRALAPDVFVVAAFGQILRQRLLDVPRRGCLNVHASLLPRHRGAAPIAAAILTGDEVTGVTIMEVVRALDAGPIAFPPLRQARGAAGRGEELRVLEAWPLQGESGREPGTVLAPERLPDDAGDEETFSVQTGAGRLALRRLQRPGRRVLSGLEFLRGERGLVGQRFGDQ